MVPCPWFFSSSPFQIAGKEKDPNQRGVAAVEGALEEDDGLLLCRTPFGGRPAGTVAAGSVEATVELFLRR